MFGTITRLQDLRRYIPIHSVVSELGVRMCNALPIIHCISGCDTISQFSGFGKRKAYNTAKLCKKGELRKLKILYNDQLSTDEKVSVARKFIARMYDSKSVHKKHHGSLNELRTVLSKTKSTAEQLPPCEAVFFEHVKRASWQAHIWGSAIHPKIKMNDPKENGWKQVGDRLLPVFFEGSSSMDILNSYICGCKSSCEKSTCSCKKNGLDCCDVCSCSDKCKNRSTTILAEYDD